MSYNKSVMLKKHNHYFPAPSYLSMDYCAIDISNKSIKYGKLSETSSGFKLDYSGKEILPEGAVISGKIEDSDAIVKSLKKIKEREHFHFVRVALPEEQTYLFTINIPKVEGGNIRDTILLQLEEHIPLKANDTIFDYEIVKDEVKYYYVEVVAIAASTMDSYLSVFYQSGLIPLSFELEAQAIARSVIPQGDNRPIMIVDFGTDRTCISIIENGRVLLTTTLDMGSMNLTKMIAKNFSLPFEEAEKMKLSYGISVDVDTNEIFPVILNGLSVLRDELIKQCTYWETHDDNGVKHSKVSHIIICGGASNLAGLSDYLATSMKISVEHANVWVNIFNMGLSVPVMEFEESLSYATVLGVALGGYTYESNRIINVLPQTEKKKIRQEYWRRFSGTLLLLLSLICVLATALLFPSYFFTLSKERLAENNLEKFNIENPEIATDELDKSILDINNKLALISANKQHYQIGAGFVNSLLSSRPKGITFSQILFSKKPDGSMVLEIHGEAVDRNVLRAFKTTLEGNKDFSVVDLPVSNFLERNNINFTTSITIKKYE